MFNIAKSSFISSAANKRSGVTVLLSYDEYRANNTQGSQGGRGVVLVSKKIMGGLLCYIEQKRAMRDENS